MQYSETELDRVFKKMMRNVGLSSTNKGSNRKAAQQIINKTTLKRELKVSKNNIVYREHKEHEIDIDYVYLKGLWLQQNKKDYWFPEYEIDLQEIFVPYSIKAPSVDRLNPTKGYVKDNVVITTRFANLGRGNFSGDEFKKFIAQLFTS